MTYTLACIAALRSASALDVCLGLAGAVFCAVVIVASSGRVLIVTAACAALIALAWVPGAIRRRNAK
jgi:hypothetical protein